VKAVFLKNSQPHTSYSHILINRGLPHLGYYQIAGEDLFDRGVAFGEAFSFRLNVADRYYTGRAQREARRTFKFPTCEMVKTRIDSFGEGYF
jgi:hypothetical protein